MGMTPKEATATAETAYGKKLDAPVNYGFKWTEYDTAQDMRAANDAMSDDEQVKTRNVERKTLARQKALAAALDAAGIVKPNAENDPQFRLREMFKVIMSGKNHTEESARALASATLGIEWEQD